MNVGAKKFMENFFAPTFKWPKNKMNVVKKTIIEVKPNSFIFEKKNALPLDICQEMIRRFEQDKTINIRDALASSPMKRKASNAQPTWSPAAKKTGKI